MNNIKKILDEKVSEFNRRIKDEPKFSGVIEGKERSICISVSDGENYISNLKDMQLDPFVESEETNKDLVVTATSDVLVALITRDKSGFLFLRGVGTVTIKIFVSLSTV